MGMVPVEESEGVAEREARLVAALMVVATEGPQEVAVVEGEREGEKLAVI